jgi:DUF1680 family protein
VSVSSVVVPTPGRTPLRPVDATGVRITGGLWGERIATNRARTIPHGFRQLEVSGAVGNFRNAARGSGRYIGGLDDAGITFPFLDSDVYKWLEAAGWELGRELEAGIQADAEQAIEAVALAQRQDGYLNTFVQLSGREPYTDMQWGHELYCLGHLLQAAVAWSRAMGDDRLLEVGRRAIDHVERNLGEGARDAVDGHPEIEMALVEVFRVTGQERYLALAKRFVDLRGRGLLGVGRMGSAYWQDVLPVREAPTVTGHAVRQLYLDAGAVDVAVETGDEELLGAVIRRWEDMVGTRTYLTGGIGSRHRDEAFGARYELPPDRAYTETCAAIASVMLGWRLLLATGEERFADLVERTMLNAVLPGLGQDGTSFYYVNPLQHRAGAESERGGGRRKPWYPCACCPPNLMRTLSSWEQLQATVDDAGIQLHHYAQGTIEAPVGAGRARLQLTTDYPRDGRVEIEVIDTPSDDWTLRFRVPAWCRSARVDDSPITVGSDAKLTRSWKAGDRITLELDMPARLTVPNHRIDAVRGCVAIERGPLVHVLEAADLPSGTAVEDVALDAGQQPEVAGEGIRVALRATGSAAPAWPYADGEGSGVRTDLIAVLGPYYAWANRTEGAMRVWIPVATGET